MYLRILLLLMLIAGFEPVILSADDSESSHFNIMVDKADIIFRGTVISKEYHDLDIGDMIFPSTYYTFEIHDEFKGESPDGTLIVRTPGGGVVYVSHTAGFSLGGEYLLFMESFDKGTSVSSGGSFRIELGPISGNPVLLNLSGWQVLDIEENGPILSEGKITGPDQVESDMGIIYVDDDDVELVDEVAVDFGGLFDKLKRHISKRQTESTYKPGKKVNHAPTGDWVIE